MSIILRNLCLNPDIRYLIIWANNPLSKTPFGVMGKNMIKSLWETGVDNDHTVIGTGDKIHKEIDIKIVEKIIQKVQLIDLSDLPIKSVIDKVKEYTERKMYMSPITFPEARRDTSKPFPSEELGWVVRGKKLTDTWLKVVDRIIRYGTIKSTEYGNMQKELQSITWVIEAENIDNPYIPQWPQEVKDHVGLQISSITQYKKLFLNKKLPKGMAYTYGQRLGNYPGDINQIEAIVNHINNNSVTRRAFATTFYPPQDSVHESPPCLALVHIITTSDKKINMLVTFRSHDIFKAAIPNALGLLNLQKYIAKKTGYISGKLSITSNSAHIYEEEWEMAQNTIKCGLWESAKLTFDENTDIDPRGYMRIKAQENSLYAELVSSEGEQLFEYTGKTAREVCMKLARLDLLSKPDHYCDVFIELVKAEIAMKNKQEYIQDRPLLLNGFMIK